MHDIAYRDGGNVSNANLEEDELTIFLKLATKESGYIFSTLDRYMDDQI